MRQKVSAVVFLIFIFATAFSLQFYEWPLQALQAFMESCSDEFKKTVPNAEKTNEVAAEESVAGMTPFMKKSADDTLDSLPFTVDFVRLNGSLLKTLGVKSYYNMEYGMNITSQGYDIGHYDETSTDYEVEQVLGFYDFLNERGIRLLYVNEPAKYIDDDFYTAEFGGDTYLNKNADLFLKRIGEAGVDCLDLREGMRAEGIDPLSFFYKTDHHWTVPASKWAAYQMAVRLNERFGYQIDLTIYDDKRFETVCYPNAWLGEQGRKVADTYIGTDDYTMEKPLYDTSFSILRDDGSIPVEGAFDIFIQDEVYETTQDLYTAPSWHYSYTPYFNTTIRNNNVTGGKVLVLGDSYEASLIPFLALGVQEVRLLILRETDVNVRELIRATDFDTVIIAYAQFMIGSHDSEMNANYKMFDMLDLE